MKAVNSQMVIFRNTYKTMAFFIYLLMSAHLNKTALQSVNTVMLLNLGWLLCLLHQFLSLIGLMLHYGKLCEQSSSFKASFHGQSICSTLSQEPILFNSSGFWFALLSLLAALHAQ